MLLRRRDWLRLSALGLLGARLDPLGRALAESPQRGLTITGLKVTPIALPDPPLLNASGCHGPYFLRNIVELSTEAGIVGLGEVPGGEEASARSNKRRASCWARVHSPTVAWGAH